MADWFKQRILQELNLSLILVNQYWKILDLLAKENNTHVNYLIESGLQTVLMSEGIKSHIIKNLGQKIELHSITADDKELLKRLSNLPKRISYSLMM